MQLSALVLAGGQSRRMGQDKALLEINGVPMLRRVCAIARLCANPVYVVTPWIERYQAIVPPGCQLIRELSTLGDTDSHGPLIGFAQGLVQVQTEWVLLLACDLPFLKAEVLQTWAQQLEAANPMAIAYLPRHPKGWDALCGFYRQDSLAGLQGFIESGGRSFQRWLAQHPVAELALENRQMLLNCNTPADLKRIGST
jgi:molybdopterin-guanine dinucleotide biosynthesis protein A